jgi:hypothetical protein
MQKVTSLPQRFAHCAWMLLFSMTLFACFAGCSQDTRVGSVNGIVRLDGQPLSKGTVRFVPASGRAASGKIQSDGTFTLGTFGESDGALIGAHQVAIIAYETEPLHRTSAGPPPPVKTTPLVPKRYMSVSTSRLTADVKPGQNQFEFDLTSR